MKSRSVLSCGAALIALAGNAFAQSSSTVETVVVTGSRVISDIANSPTPVTIVTAEQLQATTPSNIPDGLNKLPVFAGSNVPRLAGNGGGGNSGSGGVPQNVLALRNFGTGRTLVLLDGHRAPPANADGSIDVDTLPQMLVSRVDVVTGGASAVYGSDAVTGVVNFVLDKKFEGLKVEANAGISTYTDGASQKLGIAFGTQLFGGRGHFEGSLVHFSQDGVRAFARPYGPPIFVSTGDGKAARNPTTGLGGPFVTSINVRRSDSSFGGLVQNCSPACPNANLQQFVTNGVLGPFTPGTPTGSGNQQSGGDGAFSGQNSAMVAFRTNESFARFSYDIDPNTNFWMQGSASEGYSGGWWFPTKETPGNGQASTFYKNNAFLSAAVRTALGDNGTNVADANITDTTPPSNTFQLGTYINNLGPDGLVGTRNVNRNLTFSTGLTGTLMDRFAWDMYYTHGESRQAVNNLNNTNYQKQFAAADAVLATPNTPANIAAGAPPFVLGGANPQAACFVSTTASASLYPGCIPLNAFGPTAITRNAYNYMTATTYYHMINVVDDLGASISGDVLEGWAGPIKAALSAEMRWNKFIVVSNASPTQKVDCTGLRICSNSLALWAQNVIASTYNTNNVWEFAGELDVPLLKDVPLAQSVSVNLAGRYTNYSTSGDVQTWKIGGDWHVNDSIRFRATTSIDIRAPTLNDLFSPAQSAVTGFQDFYTNSNNTVFRSTQGNPNLVPEVARTYTAGVVLTPSFIPGLTASLDFYSIKLKNTIGSLSATDDNIKNLCNAANDSLILCQQLYTRPLPLTNHTSANFPTAIFSQGVNVALNEIEGFDFETDYGWEMSDLVEGWNGSWTGRLLVNYQPVNDSQTFPGAVYNLAAQPSTRVTAFLRYDLNDWAFGLQDRWISGFGKATTPKGATFNGQDAFQYYAVPHSRSVNYLDLNIAKNFELWNGSYTATFTVQNLVDARPDVLPASTVGLAYPVLFGQDVMGRYYTIGLRANF